MSSRVVIAWATRVCQKEHRHAALRDLAQRAGAQEVLLLARDDASDIMLPVAGSRQTLPRGEGWRGLLGALRTPGLLRTTVESLDGEGTQEALSYSDNGVALVMVGGAHGEEVITDLQPIWPLLGATLSGEQEQRAMAGELRTARSEMRQYAAQAQILDETRLTLDETIRQLGEEARRAQVAGRAKDEFLAMLGHELRNPLSPIVTTLEILRLRGQWLPELDVVQRQVRHMQRLVEDLLDISRIARGKLTLATEPLDLTEVLRFAREAAPEWSRKRQALRWNVPANGLPVSGDRSRLVQVFSNLLDNAAKYSDESCEIRVHGRVEEGKVRVSIHDRGIGLAPGQLDQVFEMFEQGGRSGAFAGGLGLGLAIVRNLARHHGGRAWAESEGLGRGSSFHVELPLLVGGRDGKAAAAGPEKCDMAGMRVMLVDDNADARTTLGWMLRMYHCTVLEMAGGTEALANAPSFLPDVAVLDLGMPGMDGMTLARRLRDTLGDSMPYLVALTGFGQPSDKALAREAGFNDYLVKPVGPEELQQALERSRESTGHH